MWKNIHSHSTFFMRFWYWMWTYHHEISTHKCMKSILPRIRYQFHIQISFRDSTEVNAVSWCIDVYQLWFSHQAFNFNPVFFLLFDRKSNVSIWFSNASNVFVTIRLLIKLHEALEHNFPFCYCHSSATEEAKTNVCVAFKEM